MPRFTKLAHKVLRSHPKLILKKNNDKYKLQQTIQAYYPSISEKAELSIQIFGKSWANFVFRSEIYIPFSRLLEGAFIINRINYHLLFGHLHLSKAGHVIFSHALDIHKIEIKRRQIEQIITTLENAFSEPHMGAIQSCFDETKNIEDIIEEYNKKINSLNLT